MDGVSYLNTLAERVEEAIKPHSIRAFASKIDVSEGTLRRILKGEDPKLSIIERIANEAQVNLLWLITGTESGVEDVESLHPVVKLDEFNDAFALVPGYHVSVSTGHGAFNDQTQVSRHLAFRKKWLEYKNLEKSKLAVVFAKGDSMEPTIHNNNTILVDLSDKKLSEGLIYVVRLGEELYAKRLQQYLDGSVRLISDNKEYVEQVVKPDEMEQLEIIGKVVWIGKDLT
ncbi:helix-turn-helix transcriptional regulator [Pseudoalteromonas luteoviolacea]|uniref:Repressor n=1 Tax=Pseudoalteromonas luteoviolacea H33 TaxID=1365251 RepID=A0A167EGP4_9GAMM|nr:helix-turn-helix transcriptional regulator [Pseudoalteromonas luteoviolacea]KZN50727.1 repressor [Pseudoalteromonas luteoviolacea H33]KZN77671.1 repressor [Pseudoalteromonas luteoviolacea H33-S]MBQ4877617.1 helix-turn-helix transcriptional regulator [Pseudoalteromonas luteoviolacea]MBQ4906652.1 helix-turn-helix transcriptional regulator [Pseudoalteromonas luteoviolacea]MCF6440242.1 helix-turn-helix transcriptional regulator [Pseudoalteromonas luteoviolacea]